MRKTAESLLKTGYHEDLNWAIRTDRQTVLSRFTGGHYLRASHAYSQTTPKNQGKQTGPGRTTTTCCCGGFSRSRSALLPGRVLSAAPQASLKSVGLPPTVTLVRWPPS